MKKVLFLVILGTLFSCRSQLEETKASLIGCWELTDVDGDPIPNTIHLVKYGESESYVYWGSKTDYGVVINRNKIRYTVEMDKDDHAILTVFQEKDSAISQIAFKDDSSLECTVVKNGKIWSYKRITEEELERVVASAVEPR